MCCEDIRTEKLKSNVLSKILLNEHCIYISEYLGCDDCIKLNEIISDPLYNTFTPEMKEILKIIGMTPTEFYDLKNKVNKQKEINKIY